MVNVTVKSLSAEIHTTVDRLVQQFADAGINKTALDFVTQQEKEVLLAYLSNSRDVIPNKIILQRKIRSTLSIPSTSGKNKSVKIEVRKKYTYIQNDPKIYKQIKIEESTSEQSQYKVEEKIKFIAKEKIKHSITEQIKHSTVDNSHLINQQTAIITKSLQIAEKVHREAKVNELRRKVEKEMHRKVEEKARQIAEEARCMAEKHSDNWSDSNNVRLSDEDMIDYHVTTFYHAREAEDENDRKIESDRRTRTRVNKVTKQKKANHLQESKAEREEARIVSRGRNKRKLKISSQNFSKSVQTANRSIIIGETITVADLSNKMAVKSSQVIKTMMKFGTMITINQIIDQKTAQLVAEKMGHKVILRRENELEELVMSDRDTGNASTAKLRAPVVTIMGHVDHGKTSLLDYIRSSKVAAGEAGSITQHIGAYHVKTNNGSITFLDTPGHAAFTAMRFRGVQVTDIVVLVVAADDGVMPQTIEAIQHAKAANVPVVVAVNKIDKSAADPDKLKNELTQHGIIPEEWGGENQFVYISAKFGTGINKLLDSILLQAEILELKAVQNGMASGIVIESFLDKCRGPIATILVREGTLNRGDIVLCGLEYGRVRGMYDEMGKDISSAGPSIPVEILGLSGVPIAGDKITVVRDEKKAREVAFYRQGKFREIKLARQQKSKLDNVFTNMVKGEIFDLNIVLKSDVHGSIEAISNTLENLSTTEVKVKIIGSGVGGITETDAVLAVASNAILLGFNVHVDPSIRHLIEEENLDIRYYSVIYDLIDDIKQEISGLLAPEYKQEIIGIAEVRSVFHSPKFGAIAGCIVTEGIVKRRNKIRILRNNIIIYEGELESLRRFKDDINEVRNGMECGIGVKGYNDIRNGDVIKVLEVIKIKRTI